MANRALTTDERPAEQTSDVTEERATPRLVFTHAPVLMGRLISVEEDGSWLVGLGAVDKALPVDPSVDPALLRDAHEAGARVLVDSAHPPTIVGVVQTQRSLSIDRDGNVAANVGTFKLKASESFLLEAPGAFVRARTREVELYGDRVLTRARNLARILSAMIKLN